MEVVLTGLVLPIVVAVLAYLAIDRMGEWRKRQMYSRLGVAIIESLQEEVRNGIGVMTLVADIAANPAAQLPGPLALPRASWSGMSTIPDEVLLRILELSDGKTFEGFQPRDCRIHCKNYFDHMAPTFSGAVAQAHQMSTAGLMAGKGMQWRRPVVDMLRGEQGFIGSAEQVLAMLEDIRQLLDKNARTRFSPK